MAEEFDEFEQSGAQAGNRVGDQLRALREARKMSIADVASETRIPIRHLEALEASNYTGLPGKTYAVGFAKAYARALDGDEVAIAAQVRAEYDYADSGGEAREYQSFQPADPSRVPSRFLSWTAAIVALVLVGSYLVWKSGYLGGESVDPYAQTTTSDTVPSAVAPSNRATPTRPSSVAADAPVILSARDAVWIRIDDSAGGRVHEQELQAGERYIVPTDRQGLLLRTARPQALNITVGGRAIATLGPPDTLVTNVPLEPQALSARAAATLP